jgi:hypothetical protein
MNALYALDLVGVSSYIGIGGSKDLEKLINLLSEPNFDEHLPASGRAELAIIARGLLSQ